ncbi:DUF6228 family protein [Ramlibacter sp. AN1133]|uniref:DUF6228 family protein n=1 Tax=Ramlibacter sp. AN1133 TaxID=3133429 RepID=UPI004040883A
MGKLLIGGRGSPEIKISVPDRSRTEWPGHFAVAICAPGINASITVENPPYAPELSAFFEELGNASSAWAGGREWRSIEEEFGIRAACDPTGHVHLEFEIRPGYGSAQGWRAIASIVVELGFLHGIAGELREMFAYVRS